MQSHIPHFFDAFLQDLTMGPHIQYRDEPLFVKFPWEDDTPRLLKRLAGALFSKDKRWSCEQEFRMALFDQPAVQRVPEVVRTVILGLRAAPETRERVLG